MSNLVIVAVPAEDDYVWKISSEKVPHCTLLFLGDVEGKPVLKIADFVEHAVNTWERGPFGLEVDHRGKLGEDEADVLFFSKSWSYKQLEQFRGWLLKDSRIRTAYDSTEQYDEWTPHLTLGYPRTPAREDKREYPGINWVQFDRIALWYGDYEGPEFRLKSDYDLAEVAMSTTSERGAAFLEHYGVRGMRWGVRKATGVEAVSRTDAGILRRQTKVEVKGGVAQEATPDAIKAAVQKQKLKKSGPAALSNDELQQLARRLQLEQQVKTLAFQPSAGRKWVTDKVKTEGQKEIKRRFAEAAAGQQP